MATQPHTCNEDYLGVHLIVRTVVETLTFQKQADEIWVKEERHAFIDWIAENPDAGDVIQGGDGARKVRWSRAGIGKRGGARVIYFHLVDDEIVLLVMAYAKATRADVKAKDIKRI
jgi:mRNA-degrading endonuclease RelE of RelBE toxin-antitoxin system